MPFLISYILSDSKSHETQTQLFTLSKKSLQNDDKKDFPTIFQGAHHRVVFFLRFLPEPKYREFIVNVPGDAGFDPASLSRVASRPQAVDGRGVGHGDVSVFFPGFEGFSMVLTDWCSCYLSPNHS